MERRRTIALMTGACLAATTLLPGAALGDEGHKPKVGPTAVTNITPTSATVSATLDSRGLLTGLVYGWSAGRAHGQTTIIVAPAGFVGPLPTTLDGLTPATTYAVHAFAWNKEGDSQGPDTVFSTPAAAAPATAPAPVTTPPAAAPPAAAPPAAPLPPGTAQDVVAGKTVVVGAEKGTVTVQVPGSHGFQTLGEGSAVPVGSVVDATRGTVRLTSAVTGSTTQDALVRGAQFQVRQARGARGMTDLVLRGGDLGRCGRASAAASRHRAAAPRRSLWARDRGGRFRTRGANSVATVRGTEWTTTDTCRGTTTSVTQGAVSVRDVHSGRTVVVRAGHRHLARAPRR